MPFELDVDTLTNGLQAGERRNLLVQIEIAKALYLIAEGNKKKGIKDWIP